MHRRVQKRVAPASKTRSDEILSERQRMSRGVASTGGAVSAVSYDASASAETSCTGLENEERRNSERASAHVPWCGQHGRRGIWCQLRCIGECRNELHRPRKRGATKF